MVLIASVPDLCILFTLKKEKKNTRLYAKIHPGAHNVDVVQEVSEYLFDNYDFMTHNSEQRM